MIFMKFVYAFMIIKNKRKVWQPTNKTSTAPPVEKHRFTQPVSTYFGAWGFNLKRHFFNEHTKHFGAFLSWLSKTTLVWSTWV